MISRMNLPWTPGPLAMCYGPVPPIQRLSFRQYRPECGPDQAMIITPKKGGDKTVFYFPGCGSERLFSQIGTGALHILLASGMRVILPPPSLCCGFPAKTNADRFRMERQVLKNAIIFNQIRESLGRPDLAACVVSCGTCMESLREMDLPDILKSPLADVNEFCLSNGLPGPGRGEVWYHRPCHDSLGGKAEFLFRKYGGHTLLPIAHCCSESGTLSMSRPDITRAMLTRKKEALLKEVPPSSADNRRIILTNCPSCLQGLFRLDGPVPMHLSTALARQNGGPGWQENLGGLFSGVERVSL